MWITKCKYQNHNATNWWYKPKKAWFYICEKKHFLVTLANVNVSLNHDFPSQFCSVSHIFGNILMVELRRILNVFFNNLNTIFPLNVNCHVIIFLPSKWNTFSKLAMILFQWYCLQFFQFDIILGLASCVIWFRCVSSCSCGERREFLSIPKVVFHQKVTCGGLSTVSLLFSCLLFLLHPAPSVQGIW